MHRWCVVGGGQGGGYECSSSYAYHCARALLNPHSPAFLNRCGCPPPAGGAGDAAPFRARFGAYAAWLADPAWADLQLEDPGGPARGESGGDSDGGSLGLFRRPPWADSE